MTPTPTLPTPTPTTAAAAAADRPPIVRFLLLFIVLLALATGLAAFSFAAEPPSRRSPAR